jgi:hypothetical protein
MPRSPRTGVTGSLLTASLLAADLTAAVDRPRAEVRGFMLRDARFFFLLFRNWLELDLREPDTDIDLTQIRRACDQLALRRRIAIVPPPRSRSARRPRTRYLLTLAGVLALVDDLVAWSPDRTFEEGLFVVLFAASYRGLVIRRAEQAGAPVARKHVARALDPRAVIASLRRSLANQLADLEERMASGDALFAAAAAGRTRGATDAEILAQLERISPYQLHHMRPLGELLLSLPVDVRRHEIGAGITARRELIFAPLLQQTRTQQQILAKLEPVAIAIAAERMNT